MLSPQAIAAMDSPLEKAKERLLRGERQEALSFAKDALVKFESSNDKIGQAMTWTCIAEVHFSEVAAAGPDGGGSAPGEALKAAKNALALARGLKQPRREADALQVLAKAHMVMLNHSEAKKSAEQAQGILTDLGDKKAIAEGHLIIGAAEIGLGRNDAARSAASEALDIFQTLGDTAAADKAGSFLRLVDQHEKGELNHYDFQGVVLEATSSKLEGQATRTTNPRRNTDPQKTHLHLFSKGQATIEFIGVELRRATGGRAAAAAKSARMMQDQRQALYQVRFMKADPVVKAN
jgi:tetratricopeptide (TPR) repeat protein